MLTIVFLFLRKFFIKHDKSEVFHFSRLTKNFNPSPLDLRHLGGAILRPKNIWWYLEFFFDIKLSFWHYTYYYANKVSSIIKSMKMLGNLTKELLPVHKQLFFIYMYFLLYYIVSSSSISKEHHYTILSKIWRRYKEE